MYNIIYSSNTKYNKLQYTYNSYSGRASSILYRKGAAAVPQWNKIKGVFCDNGIYIYVKLYLFLLDNNFQLNILIVTK